MSETTTGRTDTGETGLSVTAGLAAISARLTEAATLHGAVCPIGRINRRAAEAVAPGD